MVADEYSFLIRRCGGYTDYGDHSDVSYTDHSDHNDTSHSDHDDHNDTSHTDSSSHNNISHSDHSDNSRSWSDTAHEDGGFGFYDKYVMDHTDGYIHTDYYDTSHQDDIYEPHGDWGDYYRSTWHADYTDSSYTHFDVTTPYLGTEGSGNLHQDHSDHNNTSHSDWTNHSDTSHSDWDDHDDMTHEDYLQPHEDSHTDWENDIDVGSTERCYDHQDWDDHSDGD